jgi:hypothetical protein
MSDYEGTEHTESDDDLWHVQLGSGDVCLMTLEQLDEAFQGGVINENTYLWQEGSSGWVTLREVAGLDSDDDSSDAGTSPQANPFVQPDRASESVWPSAPAAQTYGGYPAQDIYAPPLQNMGPHSTAPVVSPLRDMEFDLEPVNFGRKKRSTGKWLFAAAVIGAAGFGATKYNLLPSTPSNASPMVNAALAMPLPTPEATVAPTPPPPAPVAAAPVETTPAKALPDDVKQRLANADKKLADKHKAKQQQAQTRHASSPRSGRRASGGGDKVFTKGGETGDPLNSSL